jgi:hypothetical protein
MPEIRQNFQGPALLVYVHLASYCPQKAQSVLFRELSVKLQLAIFIIYYWAIRDTNVHADVTEIRNSDQSFFSMHDLPIVSPSKAPTSTKEIGV